MSDDSEKKEPTEAMGSPEGPAPDVPLSDDLTMRESFGTDMTAPHQAVGDLSEIGGDSTLAAVPTPINVDLRATRQESPAGHQESVTKVGGDASSDADDRADLDAKIRRRMGITAEEYNFFRADLERTGALENAVLFVNLADDPAVERIITPRLALTAAEYLAFEKDYHVLVIYTDMTNYCDALRQIGAAREEVPGRRGYPGYMYTDLAMLYERAGLVKGKKGSITQFPILTMPGDDITHPIPDLSGYITEGQIVISRELHQAGIYPPINVLPSLSRLMGSCIGEKTTREDHKSVSDQMYAAYAQGRELRGLVAIVGEDALNERDKQLLEFSGVFEDKFLRQSRYEDRSIGETLDLCWTLMSSIDTKYLVRLDQKWIDKYHPDNRE